MISKVKVKLERQSEVDICIKTMKIKYKIVSKYLFLCLSRLHLLAYRFEIIFQKKYSEFESRLHLILIQWPPHLESILTISKLLFDVSKSKRLVIIKEPQTKLRC